MMNPAEREQVRLSMLRHLSANPTRFGITPRLLRQYMRADGQPVTDAECEAELLYLQDKQLICETTKHLSPENRAWRITAAGRDLIATAQGE